MANKPKEYETNGDGSHQDIESLTQQKLLKRYEPFANAIYMHRLGKIRQRAQKEMAPFAQEYEAVQANLKHVITQLESRDIYHHYPTKRYSPVKLKDIISSFLEKRNDEPSRDDEVFLLSFIKGNEYAETILADEFLNNPLGKVVLESVVRDLIFQLDESVLRMARGPVLDRGERTQVENYIVQLFLSSPPLARLLLSHLEYMPEENGFALHRADQVAAAIVEEMQKNAIPRKNALQRTKISLLHNYSQVIHAALSEAQRLNTDSPWHSISSLLRQLTIEGPSNDDVLAARLPSPQTLENIHWTPSVIASLQQVGIVIVTSPAFLKETKGGKRFSQDLSALLPIMRGFDFFHDMTAVAQEYTDELQLPVDRLEGDHAHIVACCVSMWKKAIEIQKQLRSLRCDPRIRGTHVDDLAVCSRFFEQETMYGYFHSVVSATDPKVLIEAISSLSIFFSMQRDVWTKTTILDRTLEITFFADNAAVISDMPDLLALKVYAQEHPPVPTQSENDDAEVERRVEELLNDRKALSPFSSAAEVANFEEMVARLEEEETPPLTFNSDGEVSGDHPFENSSTRTSE